MTMPVVYHTPISNKLHRAITFFFVKKPTSFLLFGEVQYFKGEYEVKIDFDECNTRIMMLWGVVLLLSYSIHFQIGLLILSQFPMVTEFSFNPEWCL